MATAPATLVVRGLGSCVAVILYDPTAHVAGLAYIVLPEEPKVPADGRTRSAPGAIEGLLAKMVKHGARRVALIAHVVGGAQVLRTAGGTTIGQRNVALGLELDSRPVEVSASDLIAGAVIAIQHR